MQVDTCLGAQQMVDILTNKNLSLEDQVRELQENVDNLVSFTLSSSTLPMSPVRNKESLCEMDKGKTSPSLSCHASSSRRTEMEENAKEVEHDLLQKVDLLENQIREVRLSDFSRRSRRTPLSSSRKNGKWNSSNLPSAITNEPF